MPPRLTDEARTKILNLLASGLNIKQAAKEVGSSPGTVARIKHQADEALAKASRKARGLVAVAPPPRRRRHDGVHRLRCAVRARRAPRRRERAAEAHPGGAVT